MREHEQKITDDPWEKLACGCYAEWTGERWQVAASSFLCDHKQGDPVDGAPPLVTAD